MKTIFFLRFTILIFTQILYIHTYIHNIYMIHIIYMYIYIYGSLLVLTLTMRELRHWPSIAGMSPQSHCGDEEDGRIGLSS